jgi:hypothetical protein
MAERRVRGCGCRSVSRIEQPPAPGRRGFHPRSQVRRPGCLINVPNAWRPAAPARSATGDEAGVVRADLSWNRRTADSGPRCPLGDGRRRQAAIDQRSFGRVHVSSCDGAAQPRGAVAASGPLRRRTASASPPPSVPVHQHVAPAAAGASRPTYRRTRETPWVGRWARRVRLGRAGRLRSSSVTV